MSEILFSRPDQNQQLVSDLKWSEFRSSLASAHARNPILTLEKGEVVSNYCLTDKKASGCPPPSGAHQVLPILQRQIPHNHNQPIWMLQQREILGLTITTSRIHCSRGAKWIRVKRSRTEEEGITTSKYRCNLTPRGWTVLLEEKTKPSIDTCEVSSFSAWKSRFSPKNRPWWGQTASHDDSTKIYYRHMLFISLIKLLEQTYKH